MSCQKLQLSHIIIVMKQRLSLLQVCRLPDVQLHSKTAFFKSLINRQTTQAQQMKAQIVKLSYTVKTIGIKGNEVGITSKRLPLKKPQKTISMLRQTAQQLSANVLPHKSFYSQPLIPIRHMKQSKIRQNTVLQIDTKNRVSIVQETVPAPRYSRFKGRSASMSNLKSHRKKREQDLNELGKVQGGYMASTVKKSFSSLLKQCKVRNYGQQLNPLLHEQNPLFKKIVKLKSGYKGDHNESVGLTSRQNFTSRTTIRRYHEQV